MTAILITIYLTGFLCMTGFVLIALGIGAMFGSYPTKDIWKAFVIGAVWPIPLGWSCISFTMHKFKG